MGEAEVRQSLTADPILKHNRTMEAKKLMIGDWVSDGTAHPNCVVTGIGEDGYISLVRMNDQWKYQKHHTGVSPVALSPEILESNDFWKKDNVWSWWNDEQTQSVDIYWEYDVAHVEVENGLQTHIETRITDVHELQHLLSVADIDLDIKL